MLEEPEMGEIINSVIKEPKYKKHKSHYISNQYYIELNETLDTYKQYKIRKTKEKD